LLKENPSANTTVTVRTKDGQLLFETK
jgi:hypothetical protein